MGSCTSYTSYPSSWHRLCSPSGRAASCSSRCHARVRSTQSELCGSGTQSSCSLTSARYGHTRSVGCRRDGLSSSTLSAWVRIRQTKQSLCFPDCFHVAVEPSKAQLLFLDFSIIFLSFILTTISFETSYIANAPSGSTDTLAPSISHNAYETIPPSHTAHTTDTLVLELTLAHFTRHIRNPPPPLDDDGSGSGSNLLPLPATSAALPRALRAVMQARAARARRQTPEQGQAQGAGQPSAGEPARAQGDDAGTRRVPGAMDDPD